MVDEELVKFHTVIVIRYFNILQSYMIADYAKCNHYVI